jgi:hypothetical protein
MGGDTLRSCDMRIKKPESYVEKDGRLYYIGNTDGSPRAAETHHRTNKNRMWVNGKYIGKDHPLHKPGRYKNFEQAAFSSLEKYESSVEGQVYAITNPNFPDWVKIGMAIDAEDRLNGYQTSSPFRDYVLQYRYDVNDRRQAESQAHTELQKLYERRGEWFKCTPEQARVVVSSTAEEYK